MMAKTNLALVPKPGSPGSVIGRGLADLERDRRADVGRPAPVRPEAIVAEVRRREADQAAARMASDFESMREALADRDRTIRGLRAELARADERAAEAARAARVEAHATAKHGGRLPSILSLGR